MSRRWKKELMEWGIERRYASLAAIWPDGTFDLLAHSSECPEGASLSVLIKRVVWHLATAEQLGELRERLLRWGVGHLVENPSREIAMPHKPRTGKPIHFETRLLDKHNQGERVLIALGFTTALIEERASGRQAIAAFAAGYEQEALECARYQTMRKSDDLDDRILASSIEITGGAADNVAR